MINHYKPYQELRAMSWEDMTDEERGRAVRIAAIPPLVFKALEGRSNDLLSQILELEKERDCIIDFLNGELQQEE